MERTRKLEGSMQETGGKEAADQLEGSTPVEDGDEEERVVFPVCGEIFN